MRPRRSKGYTLWTGSGLGSYRSWERAVGAARFAAAQSSANVSMFDDDSGQMWDVEPDGRISKHHA